MSFLFWSPAAYVLSSVSSFPHVVSSVICMQLDAPYQEGAITISSAFVYGNKSMNIAHLIFSSVIMIAIIFTTGLMLMKLRKRKLMSTTIRPYHRTKAEATLTVTMFLIMVPSLFTQILSVSSLTGWPYYSYILLVRPLLIDSRVNIVSCYFYLKHPVFKQKEVSTAVTVRSLNTTSF